MLWVYCQALTNWEDNLTSRIWPTLEEKFEVLSHASNSQQQVSFLSTCCGSLRCSNVKPGLKPSISDTDPSHQNWLNALLRLSPAFKVLCSVNQLLPTTTLQSFLPWSPQGKRNYYTHSKTPENAGSQMHNTLSEPFPSNCLSRN